MGRSSKDKRDVYYRLENKQMTSLADYFVYKQAEGPGVVREKKIEKRRKKLKKKFNFFKPITPPGHP